MAWLVLHAACLLGLHIDSHATSALGIAEAKRAATVALLVCHHTLLSKHCTMISALPLDLDHHQSLHTSSRHNPLYALGSADTTGLTFFETSTAGPVLHLYHEYSRTCILSAMRPLTHTRFCASCPTSAQRTALLTSPSLVQESREQIWIPLAIVLLSLTCREQILDWTADDVWFFLVGRRGRGGGGLVERNVKTFLDFFGGSRVGRRTRCVLGRLAAGYL